MEKKDLALKLLGLPGSERELLKEHLESCNELAKSVIERDFCGRACPQKKKFGKSFNWAKHCGSYLGETLCKPAEEYDSFYRSLKSSGVDL